LQLEAKAHITVRKWIDGGGLRNGRAISEDGICEIHRRFCAELPEELLWVEDPDTKERIKIVPGELRRRDVKLGNHVPISPGAIPRFLNQFEHVYGHIGKTDAILGTAPGHPGHHRLLWIHPFFDGKRLARLMSHAVLLETLDTGAVWSTARGFARKVAEYKRHLAACDSPRRNDLDGRGVLSEEALAAFTKFFLEVCVDQVEFMEGLMQRSQCSSVDQSVCPFRNRIREKLPTQELARPLNTRAFPGTDSHGRLGFITFYVYVLSLAYPQALSSSI
jgi:Fic family protein